MRRTRHVVLPVKSWQYMGLLVVSLACLTLGLVSRDRGGRSGSLAGPELKHTAPHEVDACPNVHPFNRLPPYDESAHEKDLNANILRTQTSLDGSSEKTRSMLTRGTSSIRDRRSIITDRRIRMIDGSRIRVADSKGPTSASSRISKVRENGANVRSAKADREVPRLSSRHLESSSDRSSRSRSAIFRDESSTTIGHVNRQRRSSADDRRRQETSVRRNTHTEKQRLTSQSYNERREDRIARSRFRVADANRRERRDALPRHSVRASNGRDIRAERFSRLSRSRDDRRERNGENRRSTERLGAKTREGRLTEHQRVDMGRSATRRTEDSVERRDQRERRVRLVARSSKSIVDTRQSRSAEFERRAVNRIAVRSQERNERTTAISQARERSNDDSAKSRIARTSSRRNADRRVDVERMRVQSEKRSDVRRTTSQSRERQAQADSNRRDGSSQRAWVDSLRRDVRSIRVSESRGRMVRNEHLASRDVSRDRRTSASSSRSEIFAMNSARHRSLTAASAIGERRELLGTRDTAAGRREASTERTIAQERRTSSNERQRRSTARISRQAPSRMNSLQQRTSRISGTTRSATSERPHRVITRDVSAQRTDRSTEIRPNARKLEASSEVRRETSGMRRLERTSERNSPRRDIRGYGRTRITENRQREERAASEDRPHRRSTESSVVRERRGRSVGAAITRTLRVARGQDGVDTRGERNIENKDIRAARNSRNHSMIDNRSRTVFKNIPDFADLGEISKPKNEYLRQALVLVLCAIYGASLLKGKGGVYSFRNIVAPINRFVAW